MGVPKTIDNDLEGTVMTFGFDSAVACATDALDRLHTTAESHNRIMVLEVMGRYAGWIALYAGVAGGADVILIPEIPFTYDSICTKVQERETADKHFTLVVVAEAREKRAASSLPPPNRFPTARPGWAASPLWWLRSWRSVPAKRPVPASWGTCSGAEVRRTSTARFARSSARRPWS